MRVFRFSSYGGECLGAKTEISIRCARMARHISRKNKYLSPLGHDFDSIHNIKS